MPESDVAASIRETLRRLVYATVVLYIALVSVALIAWRDARSKDRVAVRSGAALCALRADLNERVRASQAFLVKNPAGIPGIPARAIQDSITGQLRTIQALSTLRCSPQ